MISRILFPSDGSSLARGAAASAFAFARALDADVVVVHVAVPFHASTAASQLQLSYHSRAQAKTRQAYLKAVQRGARRIFENAEGLAEEYGVRCKTVCVEDDQPYRGILAAARRHRCQLIAMGSHARGRVASLLVGNEAHKVMVHGRLPVLIFR